MEKMLKTRNTIIILLICLMLVFLSGCSEKQETVIKKTEEIPSEDISEETIPLVVMLPQEKSAEKPAQHETPGQEIKVAIEKPVPKSDEKDEKVESDTQLAECLPFQTKTDDPKIISKKKDTRDEKTESGIKAYKSPIFIMTGECLIYRIKWNSVNVGKLLLACKKEKMNNQDVYHIMGITVPEGIWTRV
ncbi:MAG: hypothetical protein NC830_03405, partial [Candidatus Omnitrophica bacterium]|nr:hypothetical protein [Candidatus Omnitrophota bacterium]